MQTKVVRPQEGFQMKFLSSPADIVIGGSAAGVGKTFALLMEPLRHINNPGFGGVIFRRTSPQIKLEGGLWDTSMKLYPFIGAAPKESTLEWAFAKGPKLKFSHLEYEKNILDWQGSQIPFIGFDELTHFSERMFFYLLSRNRSTCGIKPYVRATCNPDPESWVAELISWWIDEDTGFPIPDRDGVLRYFTKDGDTYIWGDSYDEVIAKSKFLLDDRVAESGLDAHHFVKSITFISGVIYDNKELLKSNPQYLSNLMAQDSATRASLLDGNWHFVISDNDIYNYTDFLGLFENEYESKSNDRYITADIALKGSNKFVVGVWYGKELMDIEILDKSDGKQVVETIKRMARDHRVPNKHIIYDADGVGGFVDGFIVGAVPFNGGAAPLMVLDENSGKMVKENYYNLKTQLVYRQGLDVTAGIYRINDHAASKPYNEKMTVRQRFLFERKAFKRDKIDAEGKLRIIPKDQMKAILQGDSPDVMDMFFMRQYFEIAPKTDSGDVGQLLAAFQ
jgi:hypothetical protein